MAEVTVGENVRGLIECNKRSHSVSESMLGGGEEVLEREMRTTGPYRNL